MQAQIVSTPNTLYLIAGGTVGTNDGTGPNAQFSHEVYGLVKNIDGNLYVTDTNNHTIRRITPAGVVTTFAGTTGTCGYADGTGTAAQFCRPSGITADAGGDLYVADFGNATIRRITPAGVVTTFAGSAGTCGYADGTGTAASFCRPYAITADASGLWVTDAAINTIRRITPAGVVTTFAGTFTAGACGYADGTGPAAQFCNPYGITIGAGGNVYVADTVNQAIRQITPAGVVTTFAGSAGTCGYADGTGTAAQFCYPIGVAADAGGNLYVADFSGSTVRRITPAGVVSTVAGTAGNFFTDGPYPMALPGTIANPSAVAVLGTNQLAVPSSTSKVLGVNLAPALVPMASFSPTLVVTRSPGPSRIVFSSNLTLGTNGAAFNPPTDGVQVQFNAPNGSGSALNPGHDFQPVGDGYRLSNDSEGLVINATVQPQGAGKYRVNIAAEGGFLDTFLSTLANPVTVTLHLGSNVGTSTIAATISPKPR